VQPFPSEHAVPSAFAGVEHTPLAGSHAPAEWHWSGAAHATGFAPVHAPATHVSVWVQAFPSEQAVPSATTCTVHAPVAALQLAV
jgi:hypothetical protein